MAYIPNVYVEVTAYPEDFIREVVGDIVIQRVNLARTTFKEAENFKDKIVYNIFEIILRL